METSGSAFWEEFQRADHVEDLSDKHFEMFQIVGNLQQLKDERVEGRNIIM